MPQHTSVMLVFAGVAIFMFGMQLASEALQRLAANRLRELLLKLNDNQFLGAAVGIGLTVLLQSSGAVTSMLVQLGSAQVVNLMQVMGVIVGTAVGSTFTVQLISFNVAQAGLAIFTLAFALHFLTTKRVLKNLTSVAMGFGLIFLGIEMMGTGSRALAAIPWIMEFFQGLSQTPYVSLIISTIFCALIHSSAVTIGLAMTLAHSGVISITDAMFWVYGANIGTTSTALISSIGAGYVGRQIAWAHFFYKVVTAAIFIGITPWFVGWIAEYSGDAYHTLANAHTVYNIVAAVLFFPFIPVGARWISNWIVPNANEQSFAPQYLQEKGIASNAVVLACAQRELLRMGDIVLSMIRDSLQLFRGEDMDLVDSLRERDNQVDLLMREINMYLVRHTQKSSGSVNSEVLDLISLATDLEATADTIDHDIISMARKKQHLKLEFSEAGWRDLEALHSKVVSLAELSLTVFQTGDPELAQEVISLKREIRDLDRSFKESHIDRLNKNVRESLNTSSIHLQLINDYRRISGLLSSHSYRFLQTTSAVGRRIDGGTKA